MKPHSTMSIGHPGEHRQHPLRAAAIEVELAQHDRRRRGDRGSSPAPRCRGRRAAPRAPRRRTGRRGWPRRARPAASSGSPSSSDPAARQEQHPVADRLDLVHVVAGPQHAAVAAVDEAGDAGADVAGGRGIDRGGRLVEQQQPRPVQHRLGEREPGLLARRQHAGLGPAEAGEVVGRRAAPRSAPSRSLDLVDHAEHAQVLLDGEVAGQRRVDGGEIGAGRAPRLRSAREVDALDLDPPEVGSSTPRIMLMVVVLPAPLGPTSPTISPGATWKADAVHRPQLAEGLGEVFDRKDRGRGGIIARSYPTGRWRRQAVPRDPQGCPVPPDEP